MLPLFRSLPRSDDHGRIHQVLHVVIPFKFTLVFFLWVCLFIFLLHHVYINLFCFLYMHCNIQWCIFSCQIWVKNSLVICLQLFRMIWHTSKVHCSLESDGLKMYENLYTSILLLCIHKKKCLHPKDKMWWFDCILTKWWWWWCPHRFCNSVYSLLWVAGVEALLSIFSCCLVSVAILVVMKCS
jgi:hypothetical protein